MSEMNTALSLDGNDHLLLKLFNVRSVQLSYDDLGGPVALPTAVVLTRPARSRDLLEDEAEALLAWAVTKFRVKVPDIIRIVLA